MLSNANAKLSIETILVLDCDLGYYIWMVTIWDKKLDKILEAALRWVQPKNSKIVFK